MASPDLSAMAERVRAFWRWLKGPELCPRCKLTTGEVLCMGDCGCQFSIDAHKGLAAETDVSNPT